MAAQNGVITVGSSPTLLTAALGQRGYILNFRSDSSVNIEVGTEEVVFGSGYPLRLDTEYSYDSREGDLYAIVSAGTVDIDVLFTGTSQ